MCLEVIGLHAQYKAMNGENWQEVIDEPVEFENQPVKVQDCKKNYR